MKCKCEVEHLRAKEIKIQIRGKNYGGYQCNNCDIKFYIFTGYKNRMIILPREKK